VCVPSCTIRPCARSPRRRQCRRPHRRSRPGRRAQAGRHMPRHHLVEEPAKKAHGVGDIVRSARREAQEFGQDVSDPRRIARQVDLALRRARPERPAPRRLVGPPSRARVYRAENPTALASSCGAAGRCSGLRLPRAPGRGAPLAIVMVIVATGGLLMFDAWWRRLGSACPPPLSARKMFQRGSNPRSRVSAPRIERPAPPVLP